MLKNNMEKIELFNIFKTDTLCSRESVQRIFRATPNKEFIIDFRKIVFISKSFAHELLDTVYTKKLTVDFVNMSDNVETMLRVAYIKPKIELKMNNVVNLATCC